jgi:hypothetical protein
MDAKFDFIYMDNTFCTPHEDFPHQKDAYEILKKKIIELKEKDNDFKFYLYCYTLGKEEVFCNLARDFKTKIMVLKERWNRLEAIGIQEYFTIRSEKS